MTRAQTISGASERQLELRIGHPAEVVSGQQRGRCTLHESDLPRHRQGGVRVVAGRHHDLDAGLTASTHGSRHFGSRRILEADESRQDQVLLGIGQHVVGREDSIGKGEYPKPAIGHAGRRLAERVALLDAQRHHAAVDVDPARTREHRLRRAFHERHSLASHAM